MDFSRSGTEGIYRVWLNGVQVGEVEKWDRGIWIAWVRDGEELAEHVQSFKTRREAGFWCCKRANV